MRASDRKGIALSSAPVVIGVGATGRRIVSLVASRESGALSCIAVLPEEPPEAPRPVPTIAWGGGAKGRLLARAEGAGPAVLVTNLASDAAATIAPDVARALRPRVSTLAAVGISPFSFEGAAKVEAAQEALRILGPLVDGIALAEREGTRAIVPSDTSLAEACTVVDEAAALAAAVLARVGADGDELARMFADSRGGCALGAGEATGQDAAAAATRMALAESLLSEDRLLASSGAVLVLALGRAPTLGEIGSAEEALRGRVSEGASCAASFVHDPTLGERALAAALSVSRAGVKSEKDVFPSENPVTLKVPAFMRRRSAGRRGRGGRIRRVA